MKNNTLFYLMISLSLPLPLTVPAHADSTDDYINAQMESQHIPGLSLAVVQNGKIVKSAGYGFANQEKKTPATPETVYEIGSDTKQFTATAVMMLVEAHKIKLDAKITTYLTGLPASWKDVTVRHLLTHTSGIKDYTGLPDVQTKWLQPVTHAQLIAMVSTYPLNFAPGTQYDYSNTGYFLLGMIIEKVSGQSYGTFFQTHIAKPLGMTATRLADEHVPIANAATGYITHGATYQAMPTLSMTWPFSAGGLVSNVLDLAKWDAALYTPRLLKPASLQQMWTPMTLTGGAATSYGFGWNVVKAGGHTRLTHAGGIPGFTSYIGRYPDDHLAVIVLTNAFGNPGTNIPALAEHVAGLYVAALAPADDTPSVDTNPQVTELIKSVLLKTQAGTIDGTPFTPGMWAAIYPGNIHAAADALKGMGAFVSITLVGKVVPTADGGHTYRYRVVFGTSPFQVTCTLDKDGKISQFGLS